jgi:Zn-dependent protease/CBS domain-containing protein
MQGRTGPRRRALFQGLPSKMHGEECTDEPVDHLEAREGRLMLERGLRIFSVRGIPIRLHWTFFLILPYIAFAMSHRFAFAEALPPLAWGAIMAIALFGSILLHELGHVVVALDQGSRVRGVTLMLLGGVSHIEELSKEARAEAKMAVIGPVVSFALAGACFLLHAVVGAASPEVAHALHALAQINLVLAIFNMLPAFPLDGGRVLRSLLEPRLGRVRATEIAATVGKALAILMGVVAITSGAILLGLVALFVWSGGSAEANAVRQQQSLSGVDVHSIADLRVPVVDVTMPARAAAALMHASRRALLLVRRGEEIGVVHAGALRRDATVERSTHFGAPTVESTGTVLDAIAKMVERRVPVAIVRHGGTAVGILSQEAIIAYLRDRTFHPRPSIA